MTSRALDTSGDVTAPLGPFGQARPRSMLSLAPLIDVTFLLLIFFMLVTQFDRLGAINVSIAQSPPIEIAPTNAPGVAPARAHRLEVRADGSLDLAGNPVASPAGLPAALAEASATAQRNAAGGPPLLLVDAQPEVSLQRLVDVFSVLQAQPYFDVRLIHRDAAGEASP